MTNLTSAELAAAIIRKRDPRTSQIRFEGYTTSSALARDLLADVEDSQRKSHYAQPEPTFTQKEIQAALKDHGYGAYAGENLAAEIVKYALRARQRAEEPVYTTGTVVKSAKGHLLVRTNSGTWYRPSDDRYFDDHRVTRPVTVLHKGA